MISKCRISTISIRDKYYVPELKKKDLVLGFSLDRVFSEPIFEDIPNIPSANTVPVPSSCVCGDSSCAEICATYTGNKKITFNIDRVDYVL